MPDEFIPPAIAVQADELAEQSLAELAALNPGWTPEEDSPLAMMLRADALTAAWVNGQVLDQTDRFTEFVGAAFGRPRNEPIAAKVIGTVTATDTVGHTVEAGWTFLFTADVTGEQALVTVVESAEIPAGSNTTAAGGVEFVFQNEGAQYNNLTGSLTLVSPIAAWFDEGVAASPVSGGRDAEGDAAFRDAVARHLRQISPRPITAEDWESTVLDVHPDIGRAMVIENYDSTDSTVKGGHFVVAPAKVDGASVGVDPKAAIEAIPRLSDVVLHIVDPTLNLVNVTATVVAKPEFVSNHAAVADAAEAAIRAWLDPGVWGADVTGEQATWQPEPKVRIKQVEAVLANALPVRYVSPTVNVTLQIQGVGSPQTTDLSLSGLAPLAKANTVTITVVDP